MQFLESRLQEAFEELQLAAARENAKHFDICGARASREVAMLAAIWIKLKELEVALETPASSKE